jgi:hypothetical protein
MEDWKKEVIAHLEKDAETWGKLSIDSGEEQIADIKLLEKLKKMA